MQFGTKVSEAPAMVEGDGQYLRNFKKGDTTIRFLDETDDWIMFYEHYTTEGKSFPCTGVRETCPGCTSDIESMRRAGRKYATNVLLSDNNIVLPFRIPASLAKKLFNRSERNGTMTNRDYTVMKTGSGMETEYDVEQEDKFNVDLDSLRKQGMNIEEILQAQWNSIWGEDAEQKKEQSEQAPFDKGGDVEIDEVTLRRMDADDLYVLAKNNGYSVDDTMNRDQLLAEILR